MNIQFHSVNTYATLFISEVLPNITPLQKKIGMVALLALGLLAACLLAIRCCYNPTAEKKEPKPLNGPGEKVHPDGKKEVGFFKDGKLNGLGKVTFPDGKIEEEGEFIDGLLDGKDSKRTSFENGKIKKKEEGEFKQGKLYGKGKLSNDRIAWEGDFVNGSFTGKGITKEYDHVYEKGEFQDFSLHGEGEKFFADGTVEKGIYEMGRYIGPKKIVL